jgi:hypothetical protein
MRIMGTYALTKSFGTTTFGTVFSYDAGAHYSDVRSIPAIGLNPLLPSEAGESFTQYRDNQRGMGGQFPSSFALDVAITHDWPMFKIANTPVRTFLKVTIFNLFNHQKQIGWDTSIWSATTLNDPWQYAPSYHTAEAPDYYADARTITLSCGVRF